MDAVEDIKSRLGIEDVVGQYVELKRAGRNFKALSPFSGEKSASLMVSPEKQIWHDFSSGKGGDMFTFVMEMEGLDFKAALDLLARKAGLDLSQYRNQSSSDSGKHKERLSKALELATKFYQVQFSNNQKAIDYIFKKRMFSKETALQFGIGYSPNNGTALVDFMKDKGFTDMELKQAGLSAQRHQGIGDMFRGRIMIPLADPFGRVIGFTARLLIDDPNAPKYINTPQTILYDKSRHVYGLHLAKAAIREAGYAVVVEGNLDVIASHQAGVRQTVATAGTALTESHLKSLGRFSGDIRLAFDQDQAGLNATERAIPIAARANVALSIVSIPSGKDPDDLIKQDPTLWEAAVSNKQYALDWLIDRYQANLDLESAQGKREFSDILLAVISRLEDSVEQDHYIEKIAKLIGVSADALRTKMSQVKNQPRRLQVPAFSPKQVDRRQADRVKSQNNLLALCLFRIDMRSYLGPLIPEMFWEESARTVLEFLQTNPDLEVTPTPPQLRSVTDYVKILSLQFEELYHSLETLELQYEAARLQARLIEQYVKTRKSELAAAMRESDDSALPELLGQAKALDVLLKNAKEVVSGR